MSARSVARTATGAVAILMATSAVAWGCSKEAIVTVPVPSTSVTSVPVVGTVTVGPIPVGGYHESEAMKIRVQNTPSGGDFAFCAVDPFSLLSSLSTCSAPELVTVIGTNVVNDIAIKSIPAVGLYWVDEPFVAAALGGPNGLAEATEAEVCMTKGVFLGTASVTAQAFSYSPVKSLPPPDATTGDGKARPRQFWYGVNAVCAVWEHTVGGLSHYGSSGGTYTVKPI